MSSSATSNKKTSSKSLQAGTLKKIRALMAEHGIQAYWVPSADEHINEYLPVHSLRRQYISGFTGSAGDCLISLNDAYLFVDSRYHEQVDKEVDLSLFTVSKLGNTNQPTLSECVEDLALKSRTPFTLGYDPFTIMYASQQAMKKKFDSKHITFKKVANNLVDAVWDDRPEAPAKNIFLLKEKYTGLSIKDKLSQLRSTLKDSLAEVIPLTKLDQIAWLFNLRGEDIDYNPVFLSYAVVTQDAAFLFTDANRLEESALNNLNGCVQVLPYEHYKRILKTIVPNKKVLIDPRHTTVGTVDIVNKGKGIVIEKANPVEKEKAIKNKTEIKWMKEAHKKSGRAKTRALKWLDKQLKADEKISEKAFADKLEECYREEKDFKGLSFNTIAGAGANSSIVHYGTPSAKKHLKKGDWFLVDSGCQFLGGTTDDTRTIVIGKPTELQKKRYTLVLKAHIACANQIFPKGTNGAQLDAITRAALWQEQLNFGHGTGHGVGAFLNVHEGPQSISPRSTVPLETGMVVSIEPGYYEPGWGGIRLENLYLVKEVKPGWLGFETLTLIHFEDNLIDKGLLTTTEKQWLKGYHALVKANA